jgi:hypothetical protein
MNRAKLSVAVASVGFTAVAVSVLMAFLSDHHWYVTYQIAEFFESAKWWVQFAGTVVATIGSIGMSAYLTERAAPRVGIAFMAAGLLLILLFGSEILNPHNWMIALQLPVLLLLFAGSTVLIVWYRR